MQKLWFKIKLLIIAFDLYYVDCSVTLDMSTQDAETMANSMLRNSPLPNLERGNEEIPEGDGSGKLPEGGEGKKLSEGGTDK